MPDPRYFPRVERTLSGPVQGYDSERNPIEFECDYERVQRFEEYRLSKLDSWREFLQQLCEIDYRKAHHLLAVDRIMLGKNQTEYGRAVRIRQRTLSRTLRGERNLTADECVSVAYFLGITIRFTPEDVEIRA